MVEERQLFSERARLFVQIGLLGSFTTFSTFGFETLQLLRTGEFVPATLNVLGSVVLGIGAVWVGMRRAGTPRLRNQP